MSMIRSGTLRTLLTLYVVIAGCGPGVAEGPLPLKLASDSSKSVDAGVLKDGGNASQFDSSPGDSSQIVEYVDANISPCKKVTTKITPIITADELGDKVRFVAMGPSTLLAEDMTSGVSEPVVVFLDLKQYEKGRARLAQSPDEPLHAIGIVNRQEAPLGEGWYFEFDVIALLSGENGNVLYGSKIVQGQETELKPIEEELVPPTVELRGLAFLQDKAVGVETDLTGDHQIRQICAFGDGIFCFSHDGISYTRNTLVESGTGKLFNSITVLKQQEKWIVVAVGDEGRMTRISLDEKKIPLEMDLGIEDDLLNVSSSGEKYAAAGENGVVVYADVPSYEPDICWLFDEAIISFKWWGLDLRGIDKAGNLFEIPFKGCHPCLYDATLNSALYGRLSGLDGDFLVLDEQVLYRISAHVDSSFVG